MSQLHELAVNLGIEVDKFANRIQEEKQKIHDTRARFDLQLKQRLEKEEESSALEAELERLQKRCFASSSVEAPAICSPYLMKALGEVRVAAQRIRDERLEILSEYKTKLDQCEVMCRRNAILEAFIDTWRRSLAEGKNLSELPELIKTVSEEVARFYVNPVHKLFEEALMEMPARDTIDNSAMEVSITANVSTSEELMPSLSAALKPAPMSQSASSGLMNATACNATDADPSIRQSVGGSEASVLISHINSGDFSRLDCLDLTLTDRQGICSEDAPQKLMQAEIDMTVDLDTTI